MNSIWSREPAVLIGAIATIIVLVAQQALSAGIVASDGAVHWTNFIISVVPVLAAFLIRQIVSSPATVAALTTAPAGPITPEAAAKL
jgi:multisubunit Na+/H+ antiporter MnhE subunit